MKNIIDRRCPGNVLLTGRQGHGILLVDESFCQGFKLFLTRFPLLPLRHPILLIAVTVLSETGHNGRRRMGHAKAGGL